MKEAKPKKLQWTLVDTFYWVGSGLLSVGVALIFPPAGLISEGVFFLVGAFLIDRSQKGGDGQ